MTALVLRRGEGEAGEGWEGGRGAEVEDEPSAVRREDQPSLLAR